MKNGEMQGWFYSTASIEQYIAKKRLREDNIKCITCFWLLRPESPGVSAMLLGYSHCRNNCVSDWTEIIKHGLVIDLMQLSSALPVGTGCTVNAARITVLGNATCCHKSCVRCCPVNLYFPFLVGGSLGIHSNKSCEVSDGSSYAERCGRDASFPVFKNYPALQ